MNQEEIKQLKALIVTTGLYYGKQIDDAVVIMQVNDLSDLPWWRIFAAFEQYRKSAENKFPPLPAAIRAIIAPELSESNIGLEAANKIIEAMTRFGWTNPEKARDFMGHIAWEVVVREGGWTNLCERVNNDDLQILKAQWRELAKTVAIRQKQKEKNIAIGGIKQNTLEFKK